MQSLIEGYRRFRETFYLEHQELFTKLAAGQAPHTLIIACSDSRVDPQLIFDIPPGEAFVVRNVANVVPPYSPDAAYHGTSAALEFGVKVLGVMTIIVMGHSQCGGVRAMVEGAPESCQDFLSQWITLGSAVRAHAHTGPVTEELLAESEQENVRASLKNLMTFPWIRERCHEGTIRLHGCWFKLDGAALFSLDETPPVEFGVGHP